MSKETEGCIQAANETQRGTESVVVWHSDDEGRHWNRAIVTSLGDTATVAWLSWMVPAVAVSPNGIVGALWYANPHDRCIVFTISRDGGEHFDPPMLLEPCAPITPPASLATLREHLTVLPTTSEWDTTGRLAMTMDGPAPSALSELGVAARLGDCCPDGHVPGDASAPVTVRFQLAQPIDPAAIWANVHDHEGEPRPGVSA